MTKILRKGHEIPRYPWIDLGEGTRLGAEPTWENWLKLLQIPQTLNFYRSPKIVTKFTRDHILDYKIEIKFWSSLPYVNKCQDGLCRLIIII